MSKSERTSYSVYDGGTRAMEFSSGEGFAAAIGSAFGLLSRGISLDLVASTIGEDRFVAVMSRRTYGRLERQLRSDGVDHQTVPSARIVRLLDEHRGDRDRDWVMFGKSGHF